MRSPGGPGHTGSTGDPARVDTRCPLPRRAGSLPARGHRCAARRPAIVALLAAAALSACATYTDRMRGARDAASTGDYASAVASLNEALGVRNAGELPDRFAGNRPLVVLERGTLQQAQGRYDQSRRDLGAAEQEIELLDLTADGIGALGKYLYSDSVRKYRAPPSERLSLNAINLLNYLAVGDLAGAAVEARRFTVMREYLATEGIEAVRPAALGSYLAGTVFEHLGEGDRALRYYDEALAAGELPSLVAPVRRLAAVYPYRGANLKRLLEPRSAARTRPAPPPGELLVVLALGRVPHKVPERIPVGAAIGIAGAFATSEWKWLEYGVAKVLVYPELADSTNTLGEARVQVDGEEQPLDLVADLDAAVRTEYDAAKPAILAAALSRMAARAAVAEGARAAGSVQSDALGAVVAILAESALVTLDRPDTRSWTLLPGRVLATRVALPPGQHTVEVHLAGSPVAERTQQIVVTPGGLSSVILTEPR